MQAKMWDGLMDGKVNCHTRKNWLQLNLNENRRYNQEWIILRYQQQWAHKSQDEDKQNTKEKNKQKTKKIATR